MLLAAQDHALGFLGQVVGLVHLLELDQLLLRVFDVEFHELDHLVHIFHRLGFADVEEVFQLLVGPLLRRLRGSQFERRRLLLERQFLHRELDARRENALLHLGIVDDLVQLGRVEREQHVPLLYLGPVRGDLLDRQRALPFRRAQHRLRPIADLGALVGRQDAADAQLDLERLLGDLVRRGLGIGFLVGLLVLIFADLLIEDGAAAQCQHDEAGSPFDVLHAWVLSELTRWGPRCD